MRGRLLGRSPTPTGAEIVVEASDLVAGPGDSVAVEGTCLTVVGSREHRFSFDLSRETLALTTLGGLAIGRAVNLEPSLRLGDPLDGHLVQGHVDGIGTCLALDPEGDGARLTVEVPEHLARHLAQKGSIAVNGVSLTIATRRGPVFEAALIPTTLSLTTLSLLARGDGVNIEVDVISRYLDALMSERIPKEATPHVPLR